MNRGARKTYGFISGSKEINIETASLLINFGRNMFE